MGNQQTKSSLLETNDLNQFKLLKSIGRGSFGKVRIIEHRLTKQQFALKYLAKKDVIRRKMVKNIVKERDILESIRHPFIVNLRFAFQDDYYCYMTLDLMLGGDLRFHMYRREFTVEELAFISAELASGINFLHSRGIVHRDLKPDNILLDSEGHAHLTDFNIASYLPKSGKLTSHSGTVQYMAPEIINNDGYHTQVDWWSLGALLYEATYGKTPFSDLLHSSKDRNVIVTHPVEYALPTKLDDPNWIAFLNQLLQKDPDRRLGHDYEQFQSHPIFRSIDFSKLELKQLQPPFIPNQSKSNFDMSYDLEELLLEESPLEVTSNRKMKGSKMTDEFLYLDQYFKNYNFYAVANEIAINEPIDLKSLLADTPTSYGKHSLNLTRNERRRSRSFADLVYEKNKFIPPTPTLISSSTKSSQDSQLAPKPTPTFSSNELSPKSNRFFPIPKRLGFRKSPPYPHQLNTSTRSLSTPIPDPSDSSLQYQKQDQRLVSNLV